MDSIFISQGVLEGLVSGFWADMADKRDDATTCSGSPWIQRSYELVWKWMSACFIDQKMFRLGMY